MFSSLSSHCKRMGVRLLHLIGLETRVRRVLQKQRISQFSPGDRKKARTRGASLQYLMDIHPESLWHHPDFTALFGGFSPPGDGRCCAEVFLHDQTRRDQIVLLFRELEVRNVPGAMAELGVYRGESARLLHHYSPARHLYLFDTFTGFAPADLSRESTDLGYNKTTAFADTSVAVVLATIAPVNANVIIVPGCFPASIPPKLMTEAFCFVHIDTDLEEPTQAGLAFFGPRLSPRGWILVHDYNAWPGARLAVDRFLANSPDWVLVPLADKSGSALLTRARSTPKPPGFKPS